MKKKQQNGLVLYQTKSGAIELRGDFAHETVWATQAEIAAIFGVTPQNVTQHIRHIYRQKELVEKATCKESLQVRREGTRDITRTVKEYNLDVLIAVGYRINSVVGTKFRQWATKTLKEHITKGYTINKKQVAKNYDAFLKSIADIEALLPDHMTLDPKVVLELVREFSTTWMSLDAYDKEILKSIGSTKKSVQLSAVELLSAIGELRTELMKKKEASELFAQERQSGSIEGIVGNVMQSFGGRAVYPSVEEKAANLLYFMVKNHPFSDGNKRSGAFAFMWFLHKAKAKGVRQINAAALTALTLLIAESDPKKKDQMVALVTTMLVVK